MVAMAAISSFCVSGPILARCSRFEHHHCLGGSFPQLKLRSIHTVSEELRPWTSTHSVSKISCSGNRTMKASAHQSAAEAPVESKEGFTSSGSSPLAMTYLEGNSWFWEIVGLNFLIDPVLVGNLDFGIPIFYDAGKRFVQNLKLEDLPELDCLLITQSLDDHCHLKTLEPLSRLRPDLLVIASPNAEPKLSKLFKNVTYLEPRDGESRVLKARNGSNVRVRASPGPVLGPPWQRPESGYFIEAEDPRFTVYYEPHCVFKNANLERESADVLVTPVIAQVLPGYVLVAGQEDAVQVAEFLKPKFVVTMKNGDLDAKGLLSLIVSQKGTNERFQELLSEKLPGTQILHPSPGKSLIVPVASV